ncbi:hypothetical protein K458DRAFT_392039 [Lentithecium fluviatile CBS 122367]|uniref:Peptidase C19 ubiquitin carboxyl-terminal hydrolase domain-containing protein n=1 Tax=Lentithecium fluviatile CBS 122367 TaxID=1168545 RepID=A0A6G1ITP8_9PLEO|nr:hypothetical protein K458DRAFT_392039 [Lentithecium fluviatile CBS 122367]
MANEKGRSGEITQSEGATSTSYSKKRVAEAGDESDDNTHKEGGSRSSKKQKRSETELSDAEPNDSSQAQLDPSYGLPRILQPKRYFQGYQPTVPCSDTSGARYTQLVGIKVRSTIEGSSLNLMQESFTVLVDLRAGPLVGDRKPVFALKLQTSLDIANGRPKEIAMNLHNQDAARWLEILLDDLAQWKENADGGTVTGPAAPQLFDLLRVQWNETPIVFPSRTAEISMVTTNDVGSEILGPIAIEDLLDHWADGTAPATLRNFCLGWWNHQMNHRLCNMPQYLVFNFQLQMLLHMQGSTRKLAYEVDFGPDPCRLEADDIMAPDYERPSYIYRLHSVAYHVGKTMDSGTFIVVTQSENVESTWWQCRDTNVRRRTNQDPYLEGEIYTENGQLRTLRMAHVYLVFYRRIPRTNSMMVEDQAEEE